MKIKNIKYDKSFSDSRIYLSSVLSIPEICVVGRSNVGKSSFINFIAGTKIALTSAQPGRTRLINVFSVNDGLFNIIDLPGYGFAKAPKSERERWGAMIEGYLTNSKNLKQVFSLVDIRHEPTELDKKMLAYLYHFGLPFTVIATKADKISKAQRAKNVMNISAALGVGRDNIIVVSSETGEGLQAVTDRIEKILNL